MKETTTSLGWRRYVRLRPSSAHGQMTAQRAIGVVLCSILFSLSLCEIGLRSIAHFKKPAAATVESQSNLPNPREAMRYIAAMPVEAGTDRGWFLEDPPPLPNRSPVSPKRLERYKEFEQRGIFTPQADYVWNPFYVESQRCAPNGFFQNYPGTVLAFESPAESLQPRYRFPPNTTMGSGLVTNEFGLRGAPLALAKPPRTIRIAFVGASTTIGFHHFPFSYPERVVHWLNRFAQTNGFDVHFEALNAGREGISSGDIAAIVRNELLPLDPDLAVYYEGSNQFYAANSLISPAIPARQNLDPHDLVVEHRVPEFLRTHLALGDLLDRALNGFGTLGEPDKPAYRFNWPTGVDESKPAVDDPGLPLQLPAIVKDLDSIRSSMASIEGQVVLCSFEWLVKDGMRFAPGRHDFIHKQLNTMLWPLRYADIRRLADFQNGVFRRYASDRRIAFLDVASAIPQDPELFSDAIHMTDPGERVKAWIVFQQLVPLIRRELETGQLPRAPGSHAVPPPPSLAAAITSVRCGPNPSGSLERLDDALSLENIDLPSGGASVSYGPPLRVSTASGLWSDVTIPINPPAGLFRPCYIFLRARVANGRIGLGVMDLGTGTFQIEKAIDPSAEMMDIYVPILFPDRAVSLMIHNIAPPGMRSEFLIDDAALVAFLKPLPEETVKIVDLRRARPEGPGAVLGTTQDGLRVTTPQAQGAYAGRIPLGLDARAGDRLWARVWVKAIKGRVGIGILDSSAKSFLLERTAVASTHTIQLTFPLPAIPVTGDFVIRNAAPGNEISEVIIEKIEIRRAP
jgi:hypothetical protein